MNPRTLSRTRSQSGLILRLVSAMVFLAVFAAQAMRVLTDGWATTYDDAFISFRYARNLADGYGLVWNVGEAPTEGFSNLLLVLAVALPIGLDIDPLVATRALSVTALAAIGVVLYLVTHRELRFSRSAALVSVGVLLLSPAALSIALIGMETTLYALAVLLTVVLGVRLIDDGAMANAVVFSLTAFAALLLRPDAGLALVVVLLVGFGMHVRRRTVWLGGLWALLTLAFLLIPYGIWKLAYFGDLLPNPYYIKSGSFGISSRGVASVENFLSTYLVVLIVALGATLVVIGKRMGSRDPGEAVKRPRRVDIYLAVGWILILSNLAYFSTTDTLMDIEGRFLFPMVPIVIVIGIPAYAALRNLLGSQPLSLAVASVASVSAFLLLVAGLTTSEARQEFRGERWTALKDALAASRDVNPHWSLAERLQRYPDIEQVHIAYGDAGILPYVTSARILDPVGLNDSYIARTQDLTSLTDYFFAKRPDLVLLPSDHGGGWITYGHGPLGDYASWSLDPRWDDYEYVGTDMRSDLPYDLQFLVLRNGRNAEELAGFLRASVVDGSFSELPWELGTNPGNASARWTEWTDLAAVGPTAGQSRLGSDESP